MYKQGARGKKLCEVIIMKVERYINGQKATKEDISKKKIKIKNYVQLVKNFK